MIKITTVLIVIMAVVLFLAVILIHEFGHFIFAKIFGVKVNEFAIGMGPKLFGKQRGETLYSFRLFPIGGYCSMEGEDEDSDDDRAFGRKKVWKRIIIIIAGALFNIILGLIFILIVEMQQPYFASNTIAGFVPTVVSESEFMVHSDSDLYYSDVYQGETVYYRTAKSSVTGLEVGDEIVSVNGYRALCFNDAYFAMAVDSDGIMDFEVIRDGEHVTINGVVFDRVPSKYEGIDTTVLDFKVKGTEKTFSSVLSYTFYESQYFVRSVYVSLYRLITGQSGFKELSGPIGIASMIGEVAEAGFAKSFMSGLNNILYVMALITFNLGIVNLLPFPALDGGRLIFLIIEGIRRKPINPKYEGMIHFVGLILLFALMIAIAFQDIMRLVSGCSG